MKNNIIKYVAIAIVLVLLVVVLAGCGNNAEPKEVLDYEAIKTELLNSTEEKYGMIRVENISEYGLSEENIDGTPLFYVNPENKDMFAIIKPAEGKKEDVESQMQGLVSRVLLDESIRIASKYTAMLKEEVNGVLIYVAAGDKNEEILEKIKNNQI